MRSRVLFVSLCGLIASVSFAQEAAVGDLQVREDALIPEAPSTQVPNPAPPIVISRMGLPDQFEQMHEVAFPTPKPVVVTLGDREGAPMLTGWVDAISAKHEETVLYLGMADLHAVPKAIRSVVRNAFKKESPNFPVLLDWKGEVATFMHARPSLGNVFVVDVNGTIRAHFAGSVNQQDLAKISDLVALLIEEAPPLPVPAPAPVATPVE